MLLHGPPGTGKTLIARKIAEALNCAKPKVVNGPEIFDKFVGEAEKKIRELFEPAEKELKEKGDESGLHVIIFDEIDSICRSRGGGGGAGSEVGDKVVNQLLTKMDGVDQLNNILVIGMTNRKDMIDEAILRPGRMEIHLEIGLPNIDGRRQIFEIHTRKMRENKLLESDVDLDQLAGQTQNYTGAEIEAVCRSATSYALYDEASTADVQAAGGKTGGPASTDDKKKKKEKQKQNKVGMSDFMNALKEVPPSFGMDAGGLQQKVKGGFYNYSKKFGNTYKRCKELMQQMKNSNQTQLMTLLLEGEQGCGKSALAAQLAMDSDFPFVKLISPGMDKLVGTNEY